MSAALDKFRSKAGTAPAKAGNGGGRTNRWAGVKPSGDQDPFPQPGEYNLIIREVAVLTETGLFWKVAFEVLNENPHHPVGSRVVMLQCMNPGNAWRVGSAKWKNFVMSAVGLEDLATYDQADADGYLLDATIGDVNAEFPENPIIGRKIDAVVTRGKDTDDGGFYRNWAFSAVEQ